MGVLLIAPKETRETGMFDKDDNFVKYLECLGEFMSWFYFRILVWEDGFCDFHECERAAGGCITSRFGVDLFFKMSHEVYSYGEG